MFIIFKVIVRNQDFTDSYSYYSSSRFENHRRKVYLVLFEPGGSSDSSGGTLTLIESCCRIFAIERSENRRFVGDFCFEYSVVRVYRSSGITKARENRTMTETFARFRFLS